MVEHLLVIQKLVDETGSLPVDAKLRQNMHLTATLKWIDNYCVEAGLVSVSKWHHANSLDKNEQGFD